MKEDCLCGIRQYTFGTIIAADSGVFHLLDEEIRNMNGREGMHMIRINGLSALCVVACLMMPAGVHATNHDAGDGGSAIVLVEGLTVYPRPLEAGAALKHLKKGDTVFTSLEILGSDGEAWCALDGGADTAVAGYVKCDGLKMSKPRAPELWRELPAPSAPAESVRGVPSLPPAALPPPQPGKPSTTPAR
jgi:predicted heme/steroid binding protein